MSEEQPAVETSPVEPTPPEPPRITRRRQPRRKKLIMIIFGGVVLLLLLLGALYWFFLTDGGDDNPKETVANAENQGSSAPEPVADPTPVDFKSTQLNIEITHRKDWKLKEAADGEITITSPSTSYTRSDGETTTGVFTVKIRKGVPEAMQATIDKAVAPRKSEVIAYAKPTKEQREYTNLSYAGQKDIFNFFIVTGNTEFKAGSTYQYSLPLDGQFYLIAGGYGADEDGALAFDSVPVSAMDSAVLTQAIDIVESLKIY